MTNILLQAAGNGGGFSMIIMLAVVFGIMYFLMIRPQQKQQKKIREFQNSLQAGAKVVTGGGIYGEVRAIDLATGKVEVEIARGVTITVDKGSVYAAPQDAATAAK